MSVSVGWVHALVIASNLWMAVICSLSDRWQLSFVWLFIVAAYVTLISVDTKRQR